MSDKSRRKLLKSIAAGSGAVIAGKSLPENWSRPVVNSVLLPVHAQTSAPVSPLSCESTNTPIGTHTPPGPDTDSTTGLDLSMLIAVTPAPSPPDDVFTAEVLLDGAPFIPPAPFTLLPDGTLELFLTGGAGTTGVIEARFTWQTETCSLFWNVFPVGGPVSNPTAPRLSQ